jgi:hypothetical protein
MELQEEHAHRRKELCHVGTCDLFYPVVWKNVKIQQRTIASRSNEATRSGLDLEGNPEVHRSSATTAAATKDCCCCCCRCCRGWRARGASMLSFQRPTLALALWRPALTNRSCCSPPRTLRRCSRSRSRRQIGRRRRRGPPKDDRGHRPTGPEEDQRASTVLGHAEFAVLLLFVRTRRLLVPSSFQGTSRRTLRWARHCEVRGRLALHVFAAMIPALGRRGTTLHTRPRERPSRAATMTTAARR